MNYNEDDYLQLSGLQHFAFCRRQWALIHIEQQWSENQRTTEGKLLHIRAHDEGYREVRGDTLIYRGMRVASPTLGISGQCDVLEFQRCDFGIILPGKYGLWRPFPVEYKNGSPKTNDADRLQLCAQALCLEEMLCCEIHDGAIFYGEIRRREKVTFDKQLRQKVITLIQEMHQY